MDLEYLISDPKEEDYELGIVKSKLLEIDELGNGDTFGDDVVIFKYPIKHSVVTMIPSEIFMLDGHDFLNLDKVTLFFILIHKQSIRDSFIKFQKPYPDDKDLRRAFIEMNRWNQYKNDIVSNIKTDYVNKKE